MSDNVTGLLFGAAAAAVVGLFGYAVAAAVLPKGDDLQLERQIGEGHFGDVWRGELNGQVVAIKMLKDKDAIDTDSLLREAEVMKGLRHANIVTFVGVYDFQGRPTIVMEYLENGSLDDYLSRGQGRNMDVRKLVQLIIQVARGMVYLEKKNIIHRDLAARNVLVGKRGECKVSDFGMTRILDDEYYFSSYGAALPTRWTAPEALANRAFTLKSDVWSFGMMCYEVVTKGGFPFPRERNNRSVQDILRNAFYDSSSFRPRDCLPQAGECPDRLYDVMLRCWTVQKERRPNISGLMNQIERII